MSAPFIPAEEARIRAIVVEEMEPLRKVVLSIYQSMLTLHHEQAASIAQTREPAE